MNPQTPVHDDNGHFVPLREYVERIFDERAAALSLALANSEKALDRARTHIENIFEEHRRAHSQKHQDDEKALEAARQAVNLRLEKLNELRSEVIQDRGEYVRRDVFESQIKPLLEFRSRALGFGALVALLSGAVGAVIARVLGA